MKRLFSLFQWCPSRGRFLHRINSSRLAHRLYTFPLKWERINHEGNCFTTPAIHKSDVYFLNCVYFVCPDFVADFLPNITLFCLEELVNSSRCFCNLRWNGTSKPMLKWPLSCQDPLTVLPIKAFWGWLLSPPSSKQSTTDLLQRQIYWSKHRTVLLGQTKTHHWQPNLDC